MVKSQKVNQIAKIHDDTGSPIENCSKIFKIGDGALFFFHHSKPPKVAQLGDQIMDLATLFTLQTLLQMRNDKVYMG